MDDIKKEAKIEILKMNEQQCCNTIYNLTIQGEAHNMVGDKKSADNIVEQLTKTIKLKNFYSKKIKELIPKVKK